MGGLVPLEPLIATLAAAAAAAAASESGQRAARRAVGAVREAVRPTLLVLPAGLEAHRKQLMAAAQGNGLKPGLLAALSLQEVRNSDPTAVRREPVPGWIAGPAFAAARRAGWTDAQLATSYGLGQVLGATAWSLGYRGRPEGLLEPRTSLELGARYLARQIRRAGGVRMGLVRYNGGNAAVGAVRRGEAHFSARYADMVLARQKLLEAARPTEALASDPRRYVT